MSTTTRYTVEFRKDADHPWQEAEPGLPRDQRYPATQEEAEEQVQILRETDEIDGVEHEYRVETIEFDAAEWGDPAETLELYEVNDGTLYLACPEEGIATIMPRDGDLLTDCRLYRDSWEPEDTPDEVHALAEVQDLLDDQQTRHIATYRISTDDLRIHVEPEQMGHAAREYLRISLEAQA